MFKIMVYERSRILPHNHTRKVKKSQYATKRIRIQRINPSIPLPSIVKHACITARITAAVASDFDVGKRRLPRVSFSGFSFMALNFLIEDSTIKKSRLIAELFNIYFRRAVF